MRNGWIKNTAVCLSLLILGLVIDASAFPSPVFANGNTPPAETKPEEDPCAETKARLEKLEAEKRAREKRAAEARKRAAAAAKKKAAADRAAKEKRAAEEARRIASEDLVRQTLNTGRNLVEEGRFHTALGVLRGFVKSNPHSADGWYWLSRAHHALGDYDRAQFAANVALEIDPYYAALTKTPNGLQPMPKLTKQQKKEPRPSMSVLPVKQPVPTRLRIEPVTISFPILVEEGRVTSDDETYTAEGAARDPETGAYLRYDPYPPMERGMSVAWQQNDRFTEISRWRFRVERMGILKEPRVPVAWKGAYPYEVYFWTGTEWARVRREHIEYENQETYDDILNRAQSAIAEVLAERGYRWQEADTPALAANASLMRYAWVGDVDLGKARARAERRARERFMDTPGESETPQADEADKADQESGNLSKER